MFELLGPNLYEVMRANSFKPFSVAEIRILARQVLESLSHTHAKGVVHTDVKPENVLFEELLHKRRNSNAQAQGGRLQVTPGTQVNRVAAFCIHHALLKFGDSRRFLSALHSIGVLRRGIPCLTVPTVHASRLP